MLALKTIGDADRLVARTERLQRAVIIGGGLIGVQAANALRREGRQITKVIGSKQPLSRNVDSACARIVCESIRECGIEMTFESNAVAIDKTQDGLSVRLNSGRSLAADTVVIGKGVRPNIGWLGGSDIRVDRGVVVDDTLRTNCDDIFAAGDVAQGTDFLSGEKQLIATWPNACDQGRAAGTNMAGGDCRFQALSGNVCSFLGRTVASVGITQRPDQYHEELVHAPPGKEIYRKLIWNLDDQLVGAVLMGQVADIGILRAMIRSRVRIPWSQKKAMIRGPVRYGDFFAKQAGSFLSVR